jgi:hypothetical protein
MAENKDIYKLGQSNTGSIEEIGEEIRIDLELEENSVGEVGTVFGKTVDTDNKPVAGVTVKITDTSYNPKYHAVTDVKGEFTIDNVYAGNQYLILAVKNKYELKQGVPFVIQKAQLIERNFKMTLDSGSANSLVAGDIINEKGSKLENVSVSLFDNNGLTPILIKTTHTNVFGQYAFFDVSKGMYTLEAVFLGYKESDTTFIISDGEQVMNINLTMLDDPESRKGTINGVINDKKGVPVASAYVILFEVLKDEQGKEKLNPIRRTVTNDEGVYLFEQVPDGSYKIKANKLKA